MISGGSLSDYATAQLTKLLVVVATSAIILGILFGCGLTFLGG